MQIIDVNSWYKFMIDAISKGPHQTAPQLLCVGLPRKRHQWSAHESREVLAATVVFQWSATGLVRHWVQPANSSQGIGMKNKITTTWRSHLTDDPQKKSKKHHDIMESIGVLYQCWWLRPREHSGSECLSYFEFVPSEFNCSCVQGATHREWRWLHHLQCPRKPPKAFHICSHHLPGLYYFDSWWKFMEIL